MSKAVLVMDMPKSCYSCNMCNSDNECILQDEDANFKASDNWEELRKGCPLRELPSKYAEKDFTPIKDERYDNGYEDGYNACINELLKGEKE